MVVIQLGGRTASVQRHVVGANRREQGLAPIPRHNTVAMTAVVWDLLFLPENAIPKHALVSQSQTAFALFILLHEKFLQFDWLRAVVFQLNLKYLHVKITNLLRVVV